MTAGSCPLLTLEGQMQLTVKEVLWHPERAGEFHR